VVLPASGAYRLRLAVCYSEAAVCATGGDWEMLGPPVEVSVD
jgi:hypothetical protein